MSLLNSTVGIASLSNYFSLIYTAISVSIGMRTDIWTRTGKMMAKVGVDMSHSRRITTTSLAFFSCTRFDYFACDNLVFIIHSSSLVTLSPTLVIYITPVSIPVMTASCCIGRLFSSMVLQHKLVLHWCFQPISFHIIVAEFSIFRSGRTWVRSFGSWARALMIIFSWPILTIWVLSCTFVISLLMMTLIVWVASVNASRNWGMSLRLLSFITSLGIFFE